MRLSLHSDYALRLLMHAGLSSGQLISAEDTAQAFGLSKNHLMKVIYGLGQSGFIETVRGRNGGFKLAVPPSDICIGAVVREMELDLAIVECLGDGNTCVISPACRLTGIMHEALDAWLTVLDKYTLADLLHRPKQLKQLLALSP